MAKAKVKIQKPAFKEIFDRVKSNSGIIFVDTPEETRLIRELYNEFPDDSAQFWSIGQGLHEIDKVKYKTEIYYPYKFPSTAARMGQSGTMDSRTSPINLFSIIEEDCRAKLKTRKTEVLNRTVYVLRDLDKFLKDPVCLRRLKDLVYLCATSCSCLIVTGYGIVVPTDLEKDAALVKLKYPTREEIIDGIIKNLREKIKEQNEEASPNDRVDDSFNDDDVARACCGLTEDQIINTLQYTISVDNKICTDKILDEKKSIINKSDILEYWICNDSLDDIGGFGEIKKWFSIKKAIIKNPELAASFKAEQPKGLMLLGVQGSGKTAVAKALAQSWGVGLIKLDVGKVFAGLVGESEKRMRQALAQMDAAGGIVVIDEIDKSLSGAGSSDKSDGGTTNRVISTLLTWLSEDHPGVFLIATANDISNLLKNHPELFRKGRFDEIWFSDIPNVDERKDIFRIHLRKRGRDPKNFDINALGEYEFADIDNSKYPPTGAEIESAIKDALQAKLAAMIQENKTPEIGSKTDITTEDIMEMLKKIKPITKVAKQTIANMRKWSADNANNVSIGMHSVTEKKKSGSKKISLRADSDDIEL
jgi:SpoVK/Ycf46/Vps4 family AAA+-type ATPase